MVVATATNVPMGEVPASQLLGHSQGPAPPWTSALRTKDNHSRGLATLSATTANSSGISPETAEIPVQPVAGPSNADERVRALQGMDFDTMRAYFLNLKD